MTYFSSALQVYFPWPTSFPFLPTFHLPPPPPPPHPRSKIHVHLHSNIFYEALLSLSLSLSLPPPPIENLRTHFLISHVVENMNGLTLTDLQWPINVSLWNHTQSIELFPQTSCHQLLSTRLQGHFICHMCKKTLGLHFGVVQSLNHKAIKQ